MMLSLVTVLGKSFDIFFKNLAAFLLFSIVISLPSLIYSWISFNRVRKFDIESGFSFSSVIEVLISIFVSQLITATIIYGVVQELRGKRVTFGESLQRGFALLLPVVGVALLVGLITVVAFVALIIPGLIVTTILWVAVPVAVVERPGVFASLRRSAALTRGYRWGIFGLFLVVWVLSFAVVSVLQRILVDPSGPASLSTFIIVAYVVNAAFTAFNGVLVAVSYYWLRVDKEGVDVDKIAEAFD